MEHERKLNTTFFGTFCWCTFTQLPILWIIKMKFYLQKQRWSQRGMRSYLTKSVTKISAI